MPYKDFVAGTPLASADVDNYLMRQTIMTFADSTARDTALSGVLDEGMHAYLEDTNTTTFYDGSAWVVKNEPPQTWNMTAFAQPGPVACTTSYGWRQRSNGVFTAQLKVVFTATGVAGNNIIVSTPFTLPNLEAVGGSWTYFDNGVQVYAGSVYPDTTITMAFMVNQNGNPFGTTPSIAIAVGDAMHLTVTGRYA